MALPRNTEIVLLPKGQLRLKVTCLRAPDRKTAIVSWGSQRRKPDPDSLSKAEWRRMTNLLIKLCDSAFKP